MKIKSIVCGAFLLGSLLVLPSCASSKGTTNMDERRAVANAAEEVVAKIAGVESVDAVYTKDNQLRIFVGTADGKLTEELVAEVKKNAAAKNKIEESSVVVFLAVDSADIDEK